MTAMRKAALIVITLLVAAASVASFAESYRALLDWATRHELHGGWALAWPLQVDTFIAVGELALFVALADQWAVRSRAAAWSVTLAGLAVSVAGNVGHVQSHDWTSQATAAVPPMAAAAALAVGLGVLKRVVATRAKSDSSHVTEHAPVTRDQSRRESVPGARAQAGSRARSQARARPRVPVTPEDAEAQFATVLAEGQVPSLRQVRSELHVGTDRARVLRGHLETVGAGAVSARVLAESNGNGT